MSGKTLTRVLTVVLALGLCGSAFAQINCNQMTHIDQNGKYCTVLTTSGSHYDQGTGDTTYPETTEDGQAFPSDFNAAVFVEYWASAGLAFDPLKLPGGPLANPYGYVATDLVTNPSQGVFGSSTVYATPPPTQVGQVAWTTTYTVGNLTDETGQGNNSYPYTWAGTFVVVFRCQRIGYRGRCVDAAAEGLVSIEATPTTQTVSSLYRCGSDRKDCLVADGDPHCPNALPSCKPKPPAQ